MALYERLMHIEEPRLGVHTFFAAMQEYALGRMTGQQVIDYFDLSALEQVEATTLLNKILAESATNGGIARRVKALEYENVLILAENLVPPYDNPTAVKTRLGV